MSITARWLLDVIDLHVKVSMKFRIQRIVVLLGEKYGGGQTIL